MMARFGLSPYGDPVESGIDAFAKVTGVFQGIDKANMEKEDHAQHRQLMDVEMEQKKQSIVHQKTQQAFDDLDLKHKMLHAPLVSASMKLAQAAANGTQPQYTPEEVDAAYGLTKASPDLDNDPHKALAQTYAAHQLTQIIGQVQPALIQHAQSLPEGQRKVRLSSQQVPGLMEAFNQYAGPKLLEGKEAESLLIDFDKGVVIPVVRTGNADGSISPPTPHTKMDGDKEYIHEIPIDEFKNTLVHTASFGPILLAAVAANEEGGEKFVEQVKKAGEQRAEDTREAEVLDKMPKDLKTGEARLEYVKQMKKAGSTQKTADLMNTAKTLFNKDKPTRQVVEDPDSKTGFSILTEEGDMIPGAQDPMAKTNATIEAGQKKVETTVAGHLKGIGMQIEARNKKDDSEKKKDKVEKKYIDLLEKDDKWKGDAVGIANEAKRLAKAELEGKPATKAEGHATVEKLSEWMKGLDPEGSISGTDMAATMQGAVDKGHSKDDLTAAANKVTNKEKKTQILEAIAKAKPHGGGSKINPRSAGKAAPSKDKWMTAARAKNPGVADKDLEAFYNKKYGGR
jgi:hypothetical protein